jgi:hypothetical protein
VFVWAATGAGLLQLWPPPAQGREATASRCVGGEGCLRRDTALTNRGPRQKDRGTRVTACTTSRPKQTQVGRRGEASQQRCRPCGRWGDTAYRGIANCALELVCLVLFKTALSALNLDVLWKTSTFNKSVVSTDARNRCHSLLFRATGGCFTFFVLGPQFCLVLRRA